ncbi:hypothetical protein BCR42DRAFT_340415 [Absidia repens]|uniref:Peptidase M28 n=1 Tax=Absidia repens TaxID=90262 RepID=A0A1X2J0K5_9FUNG|nr:hypothetical protein BCR42DRAFT_340415 [Absidia repens]
MVERGPISLPNDNSSENWWQRFRHWFDTKLEGEQTPLLADAGASRKRRRYNVKIIITSILIVIALVIVTILAIDWFKSGHNGSPKQRQPSDAEKFVLEAPSAQNTHKFLKKYTSEAHLAGTPADERQAQWTLEKFNEFGIESKIDTYYPLLNYPIAHRLALISGPKHLRFEASLREDPVEEDETSHDPDIVPTFHGYSKNGTVTGPVVYANYGTVEDFQYLVDQGIELNGTIALVRYGGSFRGLKLRAAEKFGCIGGLIYSDPIDDGPLNKDQWPHISPPLPYPDGPWRSESSAQRGSVQYLSVLSGDPLTPGYAATKDAPRIDPEDSPGLTKIPSLPLSWKDALPLLKATQGRGIKGGAEWKGGLDEVDYYSGPTEGDVILTNHVDNKITPIWNVIGRINGTEEPDHAVIIGNHRDAWVYGAVDPSSGSAALLETVRVFGELLKTGWRPRRTIIFASWDAEEYGLVGSTEWVEDNRDWLNKEGTVYINMDTAVSGPHFAAKATPSLNNLLYQVTQNVNDPRTGGTVYKAWANFTNSDLPKVGQLGSGSDFVGFLDHVGIASLDVSFQGDYGVYHSNYDSFHWMEKFGDPTFEYHATMSRIVGSLLLRLSDDRVLPISPHDYAKELSNYVDSIEAYAGKTFDGLRIAVDKLDKRARRFEYRLARLQSRLDEYNGVNDDDVPTTLIERLNKANKRLTYFERGFIDPEGITSRPWFKHVVYAPSLWKGYDSQTFSAIAEAVDEKDDQLLKYSVERAIKQIYEASDKLKVD